MEITPHQNELKNFGLDQFIQKLQTLMFQIEHYTDDVEKTHSPLRTNFKTKKV